MPDQISRLLPDRTAAGERQWCSIRCPEGEAYIKKSDDCKTLYQIFQRGLSISMDQPCMGYRPTPDGPYHWQTYREVAQNADNIGSGLVHRGVKKSQFIGISSHNSPEWSTLSIACDAQVSLLADCFIIIGRLSILKSCLSLRIILLFISLWFSRIILLPAFCSTDYQSKMYNMIKYISPLEFHSVSAVRHAWCWGGKVLFESDWAVHLVCVREDNHDLYRISTRGATSSNFTRHKTLAVVMAGYIYWW